MATLNEAYEAEVKRVRDTYGPDAEIPHSPYGQIGVRGGLNGPTATPSQRIADLAALVAEAGHALQVARTKCNEALEGRAMSEKAFAEVSERLMQAIHEHREGTPEHAPYGLR